jgi:hypothetical protein
MTSQEPQNPVIRSPEDGTTEKFAGFRCLAQELHPASGILRIHVFSGQVTREASCITFDGGIDLLYESIDLNEGRSSANEAAGGR